MEQLPNTEDKTSTDIGVAVLKRIFKEIEKEIRMEPWDTPKERREKEKLQEESFRHILEPSGMSFENATNSLKEAKLIDNFDEYQDDFNLSPEDLNKPLLEIGAAQGTFIQYLREKLGNKSAYGVELDNKKVSPYLEGMIIGNGLKLPFNENTFDTTLARSYMPMFYSENFRNPLSPNEPLKEMLRVTKSQGKILFDTSTPEDEIKNANDVKKAMGDNYTEQMAVDAKERHNSAVELFYFIDSLKTKDYLVKIEKNNDCTIVKITKP